VDAISQDCGVTSSISPCEGDGPDANPGFLTIDDACSTHICLYCTNVGSVLNSFETEDDMSRISIDVSDKVHKQLKALAALRGQSIKDFVLERALGLGESENAALKELEELLDRRIRAAHAGAVSQRTASEVFAEVARKRTK
jgi:uncharacterized protein (DUF1778 family)